MAPNRRCHYSSAFKRKVALAAELSSNVVGGTSAWMKEMSIALEKATGEDIC
ncbi:hypothetical protein HPB47_021664, partial [Ixodes persulcatus]